MCKLNVTLTALKGPFCQWLIDTFKKMTADIGRKGWELCGLLRAFGKTKEHEDFKKATAMNEAGTLFASDEFTGKKGAKKAEEILGRHFASLLGDDADAFEDVPEVITEGAEGEAATAGIEDLISSTGNAEDPGRAFTFEELQQLDFDWECHEATLQVLEKNGTIVMAKNKEKLARLEWEQTATIV